MQQNDRAILEIIFKLMNFNDEFRLDLSKTYDLRAFVLSCIKNWQDHFLASSASWN